MEIEEQVQKQIEDAKAAMKESVDHLSEELSRLRAGKATPQMLDGINVDYYGAITPLKHLAAINTPDAQTILINPFDKSQIRSVEKAIEQANLGLNPQNDGENIRIKIPPLTEERRKELVKFTKNEAENAKISVRNKRKEVNDQIKKLTKEGLSEDAAKRYEDEVQKLTDEHIKKIDDLLKNKEEEIMKV